MSREVVFESEEKKERPDRIKTARPRLVPVPDFRPEPPSALVGGKKKKKKKKKCCEKYKKGKQCKNCPLRFGI
jgi:hypothetical protein